MCSMHSAAQGPRQCTMKIRTQSPSSINRNLNGLCLQEAGALILVPEHPSAEMVRYQHTLNLREPKEGAGDGGTR